MYRDQVRLLKDEVATVLSYAHYETVVGGFGVKGLLIRTVADIRPVLLEAKQLCKQGHAVLVNCMLKRSSFREGSISI